jgi:hypothetical protein
LKKIKNAKKQTIMKKFILALAFFIGMIGSAWGHTETVSIHENPKVSTVITQDKCFVQNIIIHDSVLIDNNCLNIDESSSLEYQNLGTTSEFEVYNIVGKKVNKSTTKQTPSVKKQPKLEQLALFGFDANNQYYKPQFY